jgi:concanavalin A-like lectin/glucanase superfamily protein/type IX secretion system substrate protein/peptide-N-glycosidase F-like protein
MRKSILLSIIMFLLIGQDSLKAQDTITVQTLTFDSITTRRGFFQFPEDESFRKILMYHTLKCDAQTQHDQYNCGEWDYLTYNNVFMHTGVYDSTLYHQSSYTFLNGKVEDSVLLTNAQTYNFVQKTHKTVTFDDTLSLKQFAIGNAELTEMLFTGNLDGRSQFLWTKDDLENAGLTAGEITGLKFDVAEPGSSIRQLTLKIGHTNLDSLSENFVSQNLQTVFKDAYQFSSSGLNNFNFFEAFVWDGESNIIIEIDVERQTSGNETTVKTEETTNNSAIVSDAPNYAIDLDGEMDFVMAPPETYFNSDFTIETWLFKRSDNTWSRVFDFGTGPGQDNVMMTFTNGSSGKLSVHVNKDGYNRAFTSSEILPTNEWVHVSIRLTMHIGWMYINGGDMQYGQLQVPKDTVRTKNYFGKSNWDGDAYADALIDEFRIYNYAKEEDQIALDYNKSISDPQNEEGLVLYYKFDEMQGENIIDSSPNGLNGQAYGFPAWHRIRGSEKHLDFRASKLRPNIVFEQLESSNIQVQENYILDTIFHSLTQIVLFENGEDPTIPIDTISTYIGGYHYIYNEENQIVDSIYFADFDILYNEPIPYYGEPYEIIDRTEIGRFITPYGINLSLGPDGFTWVFDVTDYAHLLKGQVDLGAGNQQELIDLRFEMIKGTPPREVLNIDRIWGARRSYSYKALDDDSKLSAVTLDLLPEAKTFKVKTRLTGHGHNSNTGDYPHCCEWKDNTHYLLVNNEEIADWHIFQYTECGENAVYPQGGTWPGPREGWCPGDAVKLNEFEITDYIDGDQVTLDYDITPVPENNQGMGNGNYVIAMHLIQYSAPSFEYDAEIYDVVVPNKFGLYSRKNPACADPKIIVRNNGSETLNSLTINYGVRGGELQTYHWEGEIASMVQAEIVLPVPGGHFWFGDSTNVFIATVGDPNGMPDEYAENNTYTTNFVMPDMYNQPLVLWLKMNHEAYRYSMVMKNVMGETILERTNMANDSIYKDTLGIEDGCYSITLIDQESMGLSYWAYPGQGSGYLRFYDLDGNAVKSFDSDFGYSIRYSFLQGDISYIQEPNTDKIIQLYPNPAKDIVKLKFDQLTGMAEINLFNMQGEKVLNKNANMENGEISLNISLLPAGLYVIHVQANQLEIKRKIVVQ